jgi:hypothetical protein
MDESKEYSLLLAELLIKVGAIEKIILTKGLCTETELADQIKAIQEQVIKFLQEKFGTQSTPEN